MSGRTSLRSQWRAGHETLGLWLFAPGLVGAEVAGRTGVHYVGVDLQHGASDYLGAAASIQAIELAGAAPVVRVPWNEPGIIGKVLDAGAQGVVVPMVDTRTDAEAAVRSARYSPDGARSWGPLLASMRYPDYRTWADEHVAVVVMIETVEALDNMDEIVSTPGVDAVYLGPADLGISLGLGPYGNDGTPVFDDAIETIVAACRRHDVVPGTHATGALVSTRREQGFQMITVTGDVAALRIGFESELAAATAGHADAGRADRLDDEAPATGRRGQ